MANMTLKDLEKLGINIKSSINNEDNLDTKKIKKRTSFDRLKDAIDIMNSSNENDKIFFNEDYSACILQFHNIAFISNNDLLRIDNRYIYKFKMAWHDRVHCLIDKVDLKDWECSKNGQILIEFLYKTKNAQVYDPDSIVSAFKSTLDGLVNSGLIIDDKQENIPLIIPRQEKTKNENSLFIVLSRLDNVEKYYSTYFKGVVKKYT